jgi:hypothetical protein
MLCGICGEIGALEGNDNHASCNAAYRKKIKDEEKEKHKRSKAKQLSQRMAERAREKERAKANSERSRTGKDGSSPKDSKGFPKPIRPRSPKRAAEEREYLRRREKYLLMHPTCQVEGCKAPATEVHHRGGRVGKLLINVMYFLGTCRDHHIQIELNPEWAKEQGYSINRLTIKP